VANELHVSYRRSGGIAGVDLVAECAEADLSGDQVQVASDLLSGSAGGHEAGTEQSASSRGVGADQFTYTLDISRGAHRRTLTWSEGGVPAPARSLLDTLGGLSEPHRGP